MHLLQALETIKKSIPKRKEKEKTSLSISGFTDRDAKKLEKEVSSIITSEWELGYLSYSETALKTTFSGRWDD